MRLSRKLPHSDLTLIVLDLAMPVMNGLEAAPLLIKILPQVRIILFSNYDGPEVERLSRDAGIHAVVHKSRVTTTHCCLRPKRSWPVDERPEDTSSHSVAET